MAFPYSICIFYVRNGIFNHLKDHYDESIKRIFGAGEDNNEEF